MSMALQSSSDRNLRLTSGSSTQRIDTIAVHLPPTPKPEGGNQPNPNHRPQLLKLRITSKKVSVHSRGVCSGRIWARYPALRKFRAFEVSTKFEQKTSDSPFLNGRGKVYAYPNHFKDQVRETAAVDQNAQGDFRHPPLPSKTRAGRIAAAIGWVK